MNKKYLIPLIIALLIAFSAVVIIKQQPKHKYCASVHSEIFHYCWCDYVDKIKSKNLIKFSTREKAIKSGRRPCKVCQP